MSPDFGEGWISSPIERWVAILLKSGILFWLGAIAAWAWHKNDTQFITQWLFETEFKPVQIILIIFLLLMFVAIIASIFKRFDLVVLRFLEGYYWSGWQKNFLLSQQNQWIEKKLARRQALAKNLHLRDIKEKIEHARLDWQLSYIPPEGQRLPTRLGNLLRAIELRPEQKYGLNIFVCWSRLWLVLPEHAKKEVAIARDNLDTTARIWLWSALFMMWTPLAWWALPISVAMMFLAYRWMLQAAGTYGQLLESCFDLYRPLLYQNLRFSLPRNPSEEIEKGKLLTDYLWGNANIKEFPDFMSIED